MLKDNVKPIFHKAYTVPFKLRDKVNVEIDRVVSELLNRITRLFSEGIF